MVPLGHIRVGLQIPAGIELLAGVIAFICPHLDKVLMAGSPALRLDSGADALSSSKSPEAAIRSAALTEVVVPAGL